MWWKGDSRVAHGSARWSVRQRRLRGMGSGETHGRTANLAFFPGGSYRIAGGGGLQMERVFFKNI